MKFNSIINWNGNVPSAEVLQYFPNEIKCYYEPFLGNGFMLFQLMNSNIKVEKYICSDSNKILVLLWNMIKCNPEQLIESYCYKWKRFNSDNNLKKKYLDDTKLFFDCFQDAESFLFLNQTINPDELRIIIYQWTELLNRKNVEFTLHSYEKIKTNEDDFLFLAPSEEINSEWLKKQLCRFVFIFNGLIKTADFNLQN